MRYKLLLILLSVWGFASAQTPTRHDAKLFMSCFEDSVSLHLDYGQLAKTYKEMKNYEKVIYDYILGKGIKMPNVLAEAWIDQEVSYSIRCEIRELRLSAKEQGFPNKSLKRKLLRQIVRFRREATTLPTFYQIIDNKFAGNAEAYVDDMFERSIFADKNEIKWFAWTFSSERLAQDPLVLYSLSRIQYQAKIINALY